MEQVFDVAIIGGGINGCGCAADAALRGLSVVLFEQDDLASKTSSSSTKLIHGGLRYLEYYEFGMVKKALNERQTLLNMAPHIVHSQSFILPYQKHMRPVWLLKLGLFFYDHLSRKNKLPKSKTLHRTNDNNYFNPLKETINQGFLFYDASTDDARLTIVNALQAKTNGASIRPRSKVIHAEVINKLWHLTVKPEIGEMYKIRARTIINAAGPWVQSVAKLMQTPEKYNITLVKGSHIVLPQIYEGKHAYLLQHEDNRIVFVIPFHGFSMIGTTDVEFTGSLDEVTISDEEITYLTTLVNSYFKIKIQKEDILYTWSGIRPLIANEGKEVKALSRDYSYELSTDPAPIITILGGKITTYRQLAEDVVNQLSSIFPNLPQSHTQTTPLPGATLGTMNFEHYVIYAQKKYHWLNSELLNRYLYTYGTQTELFLAQCTDIESMGKRFGSSLYQVEVNYLLQEEWAKSVDDILMRRTKLDLSMDAASKEELKKYITNLRATLHQVETLFQ
ncbi:glycerol-3-phosphate dehydrogenase [Legionella worsleiensis]|uniref:Glycerol-3-phosphate dehydrogenase n=1 Tax=Legionella worsleiensis TaxID=45076 RepID=A0A0W1AJH1_9GAMM|nr:glycerol-3-phosphate dehydrogenase [Legionella worsleiensis]KTD81442.1 glycerol-3-phosphate dehydrogenase [Legionella worsleiensis]STY30150.1 glycerol-3-phosphate dehydrogenase [Legionella worsleiensis]